MKSLTNARETALTLLNARAEGATVCPSEVARTLATAASINKTAAEWRDWMPMVHTAVDQLVADQSVQLSWKGKKLDRRAGPYRIGRSGSRS